ncbi:hypothetical protein FOA43_002117 [Brettanomyces nanus]|uniref:Replication termination factor 2 n=1 Tax=Eeniella nana TaxID=13502 RepID=A0A875S1J0_EENNA|nr:uncharacterized protein FOA43_002117 [Brettanomyces nanus]QPG74783.1 hypothetical protein FOA43_002117 [Brettanomyces nanus]
MGNEGGTIPSRSEILNFNEQKLEGAEKARNVSDKQLQLYELIGSYGYCRLSHKRLCKPIVSDYRGQLFNKEAILEFLIGSKANDDQFGYIKSSKDIVELNIDYDEDKGEIRCPISGEIYDLSDENDVLSRLRLCYIVPCGCTMNRVILDQLVDVEYDKQGIKKQTNGPIIQFECPVCMISARSRDIVDINSSDRAVRKQLERRMKLLEQEGLTHSLKRRRTRLKGKVAKKRKHTSSRSAHDRNTRDRNTRDVKSPHICFSSTEPQYNN